MSAFEQRKHHKDIKHLINSVFARHMLATGVPAAEQKVMFLESTELTTTRILESAGVKRHNMYIPQSNKKVYTFLANNLPEANVTYQTAADFFKKAMVQFHAIFLDYCNKFQHPDTLGDLKTLLERDLLADNCVIAHSCSRRGESGTLVVSAERRFNCALHHLATQYNFYPRPVDGGEYGRMTFLVNRFEKVPRDPMTILCEVSMLLLGDTDVEEEVVECTKDVPDCGIRQYSLPDGYRPFSADEIRSSHLINRKVLVSYPVHWEDGTYDRKWYSGTVKRFKLGNCYLVDFDGEECDVKLRKYMYSSKPTSAAWSWFVWGRQVPVPLYPSGFGKRYIGWQLRLLFQIDAGVKEWGVGIIEEWNKKRDVFKVLFEGERSPRTCKLPEELYSPDTEVPVGTWCLLRTFD